MNFKRKEVYHMKKIIKLRAGVRLCYVFWSEVGKNLKMWMLQGGDSPLVVYVALVNRGF